MRYTLSDGTMPSYLFNALCTLQLHKEHKLISFSYIFLAVQPCEFKYVCCV